MAQANRMVEYLERMREHKRLKDQGRVTVVKARARGMKLAVRPDPLEKVEFEPDNSRIGCESYGFQSLKLASMALYRNEWDKAATLMVQEHIDLKLGVCKLTPIPSFSLL